MTTSTQERAAIHAGSDPSSWLAVGGLTHIGLGVLALLAAVIATFASVLAFGVLLASAGIVQLAQAIRARHRRGLATYLLTGVVSLLAGVSLVLRPDIGALALTLLLAGFFMAQGVFRVVVGVMADRLPGRSLQLVNGVVTFLLGLVIGAQWPASALWVIGVIVGIDLIATGATQVVAAAELRRVVGPGRDLGAPRPGLA